MNEAVFKTTVMGGFNKSEVLAFVDKQDSQFKEREKDLVSRIDSLGTGLKNETQRSEQLAQQVAELERQLESEKERCNQAVTALQEASIESGKEKSGISGEIERRNEEIVRLRNQAGELTRKANEAEAKAADAIARAGALENKLELIDKTEDQIGRAMLEAQKTADKIVGAAKDESEALLAKAHEEAENLTAQAKEQVQNINGEARKKLDALLSGVADYKKRAADSRTETAEFFAAVDSVFASMQNNAEDVLNQFTNAFKQNDGQSVPDGADAARKEAAAVKFDFSTDGSVNGEAISD